LLFSFRPTNRVLSEARSRAHRYLINPHLGADRISPSHR
jgi:hypothetical protein